jgi:hypothetical protein
MRTIATICTNDSEESTCAEMAMHTFLLQRSVMEKMTVLTIAMNADVNLQKQSLQIIPYL